MSDMNTIPGPFLLAECWETSPSPDQVLRRTKPGSNTSPGSHLDSMGPCFSRGLIFLGYTGSVVVSMTLVSPLLYVNSKVPFHSPWALQTMVLVGLCFTSAVTLNEWMSRVNMLCKIIKTETHNSKGILFLWDSKEEGFYFFAILFKD